MHSKRDDAEELEALKWLFAVLEAPLPPPHLLTYEQQLPDGQLLCRVMNRLSPGSVPNINTGSSSFKLMENINKPAEKKGALHPLFKSSTGPEKNTGCSSFKKIENINKFTQALRQYGVPDHDLFQTVDLYERKDLVAVTGTIYALGRAVYKHPEWQGPMLGPRPATANVREWTDEQLRASEGIIGLQAGQNKGASQAGDNYGAGRIIFSAGASNH